MAFAAAQGHVTGRGWALFAANLFWVVAYDTEYAMVDREDDVRIGVRSSAILFGRADIAAVAACYFTYLAALAGLAQWFGLGRCFALGWTGAAACAGLHLWWIRGREPRQCFRAFLHNHWLGMSVFAGIAADYALR